MCTLSPIALPAIAVSIERMTARTTTAAGVEDPECLVSPEGRRRLESQLAELRALRDGDLRDRMRVAQAGGDADEQLAIREEEAVVSARIAAVERLLGRARVVDPDEVDEGVVVLGATVALRDAASGRTHEHVLVGMHEADQPRAMSVASPVGRAVIGRRPGETVEVELPDGRSRRLTIVSSAIDRTPGEGG